MRSGAIAILALVVSAFAPPNVAPPNVADITLTPGTTYNAHQGWEVTLVPWGTVSDAFMQQNVDYGINRGRLQVLAGFENTTDYYLNFVLGCTPPYPDNECDPDPGPTDPLSINRFAVINDNADPNVIDPAGFQWTYIDQAVTRAVQPMQAKLAARGEHFYVNLNYVAFVGAQTPPKNQVHQDPAEYAEAMLAIFEHLDDTFGFVPDSIEIILEPDNSTNFWGNALTSPPLMGEILKATGDRLDAAGYHPAFVMPSTTSYTNVAGYINGAQTVTGAMAYLTLMGFHAYNQTGGTASIAADSADAGVCTGMLEWWNSGNTYDFLHDLILNGNLCAYQKAAMTPFDLAEDYPYLRQYFRPVRMGATRILASSSNGALAPLAWINANGTYAVIVKAASAQSFTVGDLPAGTYHIRYTTGAVVDGSHADQTITAGQDISTSIPDAGVIAIYSGPLSPTTTRAPFRCCS